MPVDDPHIPPEAARLLPWAGVDEPGDWTAVERRSHPESLDTCPTYVDEPGDWTAVERHFRDGHTEIWWAADLKLAAYGPGGYFRLVVATTDPGTLPAESTWYLITNLPHPTLATTASAPLPADLSEVVRLYGLRQWVEQEYRQAKAALGWVDFQVRSDRAIRRQWQLVCCAFSFCWWASLRQGTPPAAAPPPPSPPAPAAPVAEGKWARRQGYQTGSTCTAANALVAGGIARGARVAGPLDHALALLAGLVHRAPAGCAAGAA